MNIFEQEYECVRHNQDLENLRKAAAATLKKAADHGVDDVLSIDRFRDGFPGYGARSRTVVVFISKGMKITIEAE